MYPIIKTQLVELPVTSAVTRFTFPTQNFLRAKQICSIEIFTQTEVPTTPTGNAVTTLADLKKGFLTLYGRNPEPMDYENVKSEGDGVWLQSIPLLSLHRMFTGTDPAVFSLWTMVPRVIVWEKSYIEIFGGALSATPISWLLQVGYRGNKGDNTAG